MRELDRNKALWERVRPSKYVFDVERLCFCGVEARGPVRVEVSAGRVSVRTYVDSREPVPSTYESLFPSVDGLFELLVDAMERDAHQIEVTYDRETGVPIDLWIDYVENVADEELGFRVTGSVRQLILD